MYEDTAHLPSEQGLCHKESSVQIKPLQPTFSLFQSLPQALQPSEFVSQGYSRRSRLKTRPRCLDGTGTSIVSGLRLIRPESRLAAISLGCKQPKTHATVGTKKPGRSPVTRLSRNLAHNSCRINQQSCQVSGTSDASRRSPGLSELSRVTRSMPQRIRPCQFCQWTRTRGAWSIQCDFALV
jgi:hypothetical protein